MTTNHCYRQHNHHRTSRADCSSIYLWFSFHLFSPSLSHWRARFCMRVCLQIHTLHIVFIWNAELPETLFWRMYIWHTVVDTYSRFISWSTDIHNVFSSFCGHLLFEIINNNLWNYNGIGRSKQISKKEEAEEKKNTHTLGERLCLTTKV